MLLLLFRIGTDTYALDTARVAEVLPLVEMTRIPRAPPEVAGLFNWRGAAVPAIDLSALLTGQPAQLRLSTRIILVDYPAADGSRKLGLIAERATGTLRADAADFASSGIGGDGVSFLGQVMASAQGLVQWVDVPTLLPEALRDTLFQEAA